MNIEVINTAVPFKKLAVGDVFKCDGIFFLRIPFIEDCEINAMEIISSDDFGYEFFDDDEEVIPVSATLTIEC